jgi:hypothetical protein
MRKIAIFFLLFTGFIQAQKDSTFVDNKYLEDQLYFNLTYIHMLNLPDKISQSGFSFGLGGGFIKDFPLSEKRNIGLGAGLGYGLNNYYFNVQLDAAEPSATEETLKNNKIILHTVELPIELRFRNSTALKYKFWRFYPGFKIAYVFANNTSFSRSADFDVSDIININDFIYGLTFSAGYNKWNLHLYYGLNGLFNETNANDYQISISDFRIGLIFYIF